ncbi:hypothetical protein P4562_09020 [Lysinibacillus xylanilyticus]|uniref:hypothetical protein n=1 Tax=Lysinibacillus xylanilyticus TaxID=582475 RepID=UPI002E1DF877|nr:hypothetical protein [Lysinibacillus xylanilyticus]
MNSDLNYISTGVYTPVPVATLSVQKIIVTAVSLTLHKTFAEIEELSLRTPRPVAIYLCESEATATTTTHD